MDAANMLKPMLALHCIGATTLDEYRKHIEGRALERDASSRCSSASRRWRDTISILRGSGSGSRRTTRSASATAPWWRATLSHRYINDRFLPDKAIDLVDFPRLRMEAESMPTELDESGGASSSWRWSGRPCGKKRIRPSREAWSAWRGLALGPGRPAAGAVAAGARDRARQRAQGAARPGRAQIEEAERNYDLNRAAALRAPG